MLPIRRHDEKIIRRIIFNLLRKDRHFVLTSLFARFGVAFMFFLLWFGWLGLIFSYFYPKSWYEDLGFLLANLFGYLPGILTVPYFQYLAGGVTVTFLYALYSFVVACNKGFLNDLKDMIRAVARRVNLYASRFI